MSSADAYLTQATATLRALHAGIFAYGVIGATAASARQGQIADDVRALRAERDVLSDDLRGAGHQPVPAEPGYTLPQPVTDPISAATLAALIQDNLARHYRAALEVADTADRRASLVSALSDAAVSIARWRQALGQAPVTVVLPGTSEG